MENDFCEKVYQIVRSVPKGKVVTYGQVACLAGREGAARAVGTFMKNNPHQSNVPCHRVVASNGKLTGYAFGGVAVRKKLLLDEGILFNGDLVDLESAIWDGEY